MRKRVFLFIALLAGSISIGVSDIRAQAAIGKAQSLTGDRFTVSGRTPRGALVFGVRRPSAAMVAAIDQGLTDLFAVARRNGYRRGLNYSDYTVYIANADRDRDSSGRYSPDIAIGAGQYAGSEYDQGGYVFAAGMVLANNPMSFVIAEHTRDLNRVSDIVRFEGEHLVLYHNDRRRYSQTADHSRGGGHPILR